MQSTRLQTGQSPAIRQRDEIWLFIYLFSVGVVMADVVAVEVEVDVAADIAVDLESQAVMLPVPCLGRLCSVAIILTVLAQQAPKQ